MTGTADLKISPWVRQFSPRIRAGANALDVACGNGRHSRYLADAGYAVTAVDIDLSKAVDCADDPGIELVQHDLEQDTWPFEEHSFAGIIVTNYLFRPLLPVLVSTLDKNGVLIYDTFAAGNEKYGRPQNPDYLLQPAELLGYCKHGLQVIAYDHGPVSLPRPAIRQRLCAERRG